jgi:uncharacterized protein YjdB
MAPMRSPRTILMSLVWLGLVAACGDNASREVTRIAIDPGTPKVPAGITIDIAATYVAADQTTAVADDVIWQVADNAIAKVTPETGGHAKLQGVMTGTTMLTVTGLRGVASTFMVTVTPALLMAIAISPPEPSIAVGTSSPLAATGTYSDMTTMDLTTVVTWSSSAKDTATVDDLGTLTGVAAGHATITASLDAVTGTVDAAVTDAVLQSIQVTPVGPILPIGQVTQFTATGLFSDGTNQDLTSGNGVVWDSDDKDRATVEADGNVTPVAIGSATITATKGAIVGASQVTVTGAALRSITIEPPAPSAPKGLTQQLVARGHFTDGTTPELTGVEWTSDNEDVATVSSTGLVSARTVGTAKITATRGDISAQTSFEVTDAVVQEIHVSPADATIAAGTTQQFTAVALLSDGTMPDVTTQVLWSSNHEEVTISNADPTRGEALGNAASDSFITAALGGKTGTATLTVTNAVLTSIAVTLPPDTTDHPSLAKGVTGQFKAVGTFDDDSTQDLTGQVTWDSLSTSVAGISNVRGTKGQAKGLAVGIATITATFVTGPPNVVGTATLTVTPAEIVSFAIDPLGASVPAGRHQQFKATATLTDQTMRDATKEVSWSSTDPDIATIVATGDTAGDATAVDTGPVTIGATLHQGAVELTQTTTLTVVAAVLDSIEVDPSSVTLGLGATQQFTARGLFSDGTHKDLGDVVWSCSNAEIATIIAETGIATTVAAGTATITAMSGGVAGHATITATTDLVVSTVTPADGATGVSVSAPIVVTFNLPIDPATLTTQTESGACTGSLQLSSSGFDSCLAFETGSPAMSVGDTVATARPAALFDLTTKFQVRVLAGVTGPGPLHVALSAPFSQAHGFTTTAGLARTATATARR